MANPTYRIRGIAPADLGRYPADIKRQFWGWVVEIGLKVKDRELAQGLDKDGKPLRPIAPATRKHRRSAMTPSGKGDPSAPPLMPARELSRTRSLLAGRATEDGAVFYWRFDPFTGGSWGSILAIQARGGRNVLGISAEGKAKVQALAWDRWSKWKAGKYVPAKTAASASPGIPNVGTRNIQHATFGIGVSGPEKFATGEWTGGMTWPEWRKYLTQANEKPVAIPGRPAGTYNRLLAHTWGQETPPPATMARAALKPAPKPKPTDMAGKPEAEIAREHRAMSPGWAEGLAPDEETAVRSYSAGAYLSINRLLRRGDTGAESPEIERIRGDVAKIDEALSSAKLDRTRAVYRGVSSLEAIGLDPNNLVGARIEDAGFLSTSLDPESARGFVLGEEDGAILRIIAPKGSRGASLAGIAALAGEQEVLFARNATLRIVRARRDKGGILIIDAELSHGR